MEIETIQPSVNPMRSVLQVRDFMLLWVGQATSMLGDQFHNIAAAWLVLKLTGDPLALGTVLAIGGIPRAIFTMVGGAITDRFSPRKVMLTADLIRLLFTTLFAVQIFTNTLQIWMIYGYALLVGIVGGVFGPASMSIVPRIIPEKDLQAGNSITEGSTQLIGFVGPALAGVIIAAFGNEVAGVGVAVAIDALTFLVSVFTLWKMRSGGTEVESHANAAGLNVIQSIGDGIKFMLKDPVLRLMFIIIAIANLCFGGPVVVGIPFLADTRFPEGAAAYGIILSGFAGGNLIGVILSGALPHFSKNILRVLMVTMFLAFGGGLIALGWISVTWLAAVDLFLLGILNGYIGISLITGLQRNTPKEMLGRFMSMLLLASLGLTPLSQALTGGLLHLSPIIPFVLAGVMLLGLGLYLILPKVSQPLVDQLIDGQPK